MSKSKQNTPGVGGIEYEILVPAYFALKLNNNKDVKDFSIRSNVATFGNMDDVIVDITLQNDDTLNFAFQLKHIQNESKKLLPTNFETKGNFSLEKYCKAYKDLDEEIREKYHFVLYTNSEFDKKRTNEVRNFNMSEIESCPGQIFFDTSLKKSIYKFEVNDKTPNTLVTKSDYESFLPKLTLYACQKKFKDLKDAMEDVLKHKDAVLKYIELFRKWHEGSFTNKTMDRKTVNIHLVDIFLSQWLITDYWFSEKNNENLDLFFKTVDEFDVTVIDERRETFVNRLTKTEDIEDVTDADTTNFLRLAKDYKIIEKKEQEIDEQTKLKIYFFVFQKRVILDFNELSRDSIYRTLELYQIKQDKIKFIILGKEVDSSRIKNLKILRNLTDVSIKNNRLYQELLKHEISLQGREPVSLDQLVKSYVDTSSFFGVDEIYQTLLGSMTIGEEKATLPPYYIPRKVSTQVSNLDTILTKMKEDSVLAINFGSRFEKFENKFKEEKITVIDINNYLQQKYPKSSSLIIALNDDSIEVAKEIIKKNDKVSFFKMTDDDGSLLLLKAPYSGLADYKAEMTQTLNEEYVHSIFTGSVNVVIAEPGMGKSTLMKYLKNECPWKFWTIAVDLRAHYSFLETQHTSDEFLDYLMETSEDTFLSKLKRTFRQKRKIMLFFDGLDELPSSCLQNTLQIVGNLANDGFRIWLSSRQNLEQKTRDFFNIFSINIVELSENEQKKYVQDRLESQYNKEEIQSVTSQVFNNAYIVNNHQILGVPLQLYILTQLFLDNPTLVGEITEHLFVLTKMYRNFFEGRYRHCIQKFDYKNAGPFVYTSEDFLEQYEILALQTVFHFGICSELKLDLNRSKRFLNVIETEGDPLGIVTRIEGEKALFEHFTYAEYFVALFLSRNFDKARQLKDRLLSDNYKNVWLMLNVMLCEGNALHLAIIYQDFEKIKKFLDDDNIYDIGGRSPLQVAASLPGYPVSTVEREFWFRHSDKHSFYDHLTRNIGDDYMSYQYSLDKASSTVTNDDRKRIAKNEEIFKDLLEKFYPYEHDKFLHMCAMDYAILQRNLPVIELILTTYGMTEKCYLQLIKHEFVSSPTIAYYSTLWGHINLLSIALNLKNSRTVKMSLFRTVNKSLVYVAAGSEYSQNRRETICLLEQYGLCIKENGILHLAVERMDIDLVNFLLKRKLDINEKFNNTTVLDLAIENENPKMIRLLLKKGGKTNALTDEQLLHFALILQMPEIVTSASERTNDLQKAAIFYAIRAECIDSIHVFLQDSITNLILNHSFDINSHDEHGRTALHSAVEDKHPHVIEFLLKNGADIDVTNKKGVTPLQMACSEGNFQIFSLLFEKVKSDTSKLNKLMLLHRAVTGGNLNIIRALLEQNVDVHAKDGSGNTPLFFALQTKFKIVDLLLEFGAKFDASLLCVAVERGNLDLIKLIIEKGVDINGKNYWGETALMVAVKCEMINIVDYLLNFDIETSYQSDGKNIWNLFRWNYWHCKPLIPKILEKGADPNMIVERDYTLNDNVKRGPTILAKAIEFGDYETADLLINHGADLNNIYVLTAGLRSPEKLNFLLKKRIQLSTFNDDQINSLIGYHVNIPVIDTLVDGGIQIDFGKLLTSAIESKWQISLIQEFLDRINDINIKNDKYNTLLILSIRRERFDVAELLIEKGVDVNITNDKSPLYYALENQNKKLVQLILNNGAEVNDICAMQKAIETDDIQTIQALLERGFYIFSTNEDGESALFAAIKNNRYDIAKLLLKEGASVNQTSKNGKTVLDCFQTYNRELIDLLIKPNATINWKNQHSLLQDAILNDDHDLVQNLLNYGVVGIPSFDPIVYNNNKICLVTQVCLKENIEMLLLFEKKNFLYFMKTNDAHNNGHWNNDRRLHSKNIAIHYLASNKRLTDVLATIENKMFYYLENLRSSIRTDIIKLYTNTKVTDYSMYNLLHLYIYLGFGSYFVRQILEKIDLDELDVYNEDYPLHFALKDGELDVALLQQQAANIEYTYEVTDIWKFTKMKEFLKQTFPLSERQRRRSRKYSYFEKKYNELLPEILAIEDKLEKTRIF